MKHRAPLRVLFVCLGMTLGVRAEAACPVSSNKAEYARALFQQGRLKQREQDYAAALDLYRQSQACAANAETQLAEATMLIKLDEHASALPLLESYVHDPSAREAERVSAIVQQVQRLHVGRLQVQVSEPGVSVFVDGRLMGLTPLEPIWVDLGDHAIELKKSGFEPSRATAGVRAGQTSIAVMSLKKAEPEPTAAAALPPPAPPPPEPAKSPPPAFLQPDRGVPPSFSVENYAAFAAMGVAIAGVGVGTYYGLEARSTWTKAESACPHNECSNPSDLGLGEDAQRAADVSTGAFVVAGASAVTALVLWVLAE